MIRRLAVAVLFVALFVICLTEDHLDSALLDETQSELTCEIDTLPEPRTSCQSALLQTSRGRAAASRVADEWQERCRGQEPRPTPDRFKVFALVPGFGDISHLPLLRKNVRWLQQQDAEVSCVVYVYKTIEELPLDDSEFAPCQVRRQRGYWTNFLADVPLELWDQADYILVWLDDVAVQPGLDLRRVAEVMDCNGLGAVGLTYTPGIKAPDGRFRIPTMFRETDVQVGRIVQFMEYQFNLLTTMSFSCLRAKVLDASLNPMGWGIPEAFATNCPEFCVGLMDEALMYDTSSGSYNLTIAAIQEEMYQERYGRPPEDIYEWRENGRRALLRDPRKDCAGRASPTPHVE